jgi:hypothetical protein
MKSATISESSRGRMIWDAFILLFIIFSCILIPYQLVFRGRISVLGSIVVYLIDIVFLADIRLNFLTSFRSEGTETCDKKKIASHYGKSLFPLDLIGSLPLDVIFLCLPDVNIGGCSAVLVFRLLRLLRVARMFLIFKRWVRMGWINPGYLRIAKFLCLAAMLMHWLACVWFFVAAIDGFPANSWVVRAGIQNTESVTQYVRSLYWTITTMTTVGYGDITPARNSEFVVSMIIMLLGASMYAFIIGNVASLISSLDSVKSNYWSKMESALEYLRVRQVPVSVGSRVRNYYEYLWSRHRGLREDLFLDDLPAPLKLEVLLHLTKDLMDTVPLFKYCSPSLRNVILMALKPQTYDPGSSVVRENEVGKEIFFISRGSLDVVHADGTHSAVLEDGDYFGHVSMLFKEKRTASAVTSSYCEIFVLTVDTFESIRSDYPELREVMKKMSSEASKKLARLTLDGVVL